MPGKRSSTQRASRPKLYSAAFGRFKLVDKVLKLETINLLIGQWLDLGLGGQGRLLTRDAVWVDLDNEWDQRHLDFIDRALFKEDIHIVYCTNDQSTNDQKDTGCNTYAYNIMRSSVASPPIGQHELFTKRLEIALSDGSEEDQLACVLGPANVDAEAATLRFKTWPAQYIQPSMYGIFGKAHIKGDYCLLAGFQPNQRHILDNVVWFYEKDLYDKDKEKDALPKREWVRFTNNAIDRVGVERHPHESIPKICYLKERPFHGADLDRVTEILVRDWLPKFPQSKRRRIK